MRDQLQDHWQHKRYYQEFPAQSRHQAYHRDGVPVMEGRHRRCASQQSNALWSILKLGLADDRTPELVERLLHWQWPDGGWPAERKYYKKVSSEVALGNEYVDWGGTSLRQMNPWVTAEPF